METAELAILLHNTEDVQIWAREFMRINQDDMSDIDEATMIAWFANLAVTVRSKTKEKLLNNNC